MLVAGDSGHRFMCLGANCWSVVKGSVHVSPEPGVAFYTHTHDMCNLLVSYS